jgi:hypothetical protein
MKRLKISIDKPTLACLLKGFGQLHDAHRKLNIFSEHDPDFCSSATHLLIDEMVGELRNNPVYIASFPLKLNPSRAAAMLYWLEFAQPIDAWTMVALNDVRQLCRNHMDNHLRNTKNTPKQIGHATT